MGFGWKKYRKIPWSSRENPAGFRWVDFPLSQSIENIKHQSTSTKIANCYSQGWCPRGASSTTWAKNSLKPWALSGRLEGPGKYVNHPWMTGWLLPWLSISIETDWNQCWLGDHDIQLWLRKHVHPQGRESPWWLVLVTSWPSWAWWSSIWTSTKSFGKQRPVRKQYSLVNKHSELENHHVQWEIPL